MKTMKYLILIVILSLGTFNSCLVDKTTDADLNDEGYNLAGFEQSSTSFSFVSSGAEYNFTVKMKIIGPTREQIKNDVTVTVALDETSTAIAGTHVRLGTPTITVSTDNNYLALLPVTILTAGIVAPLDVAPVLVLKVVSATGDESVTSNGKTIAITLNYGCFSDLEGTYNVTTVYTATSGAVSTLNWTEFITETGVGTYRTARVGHWTPAQLGGTPGFTFYDVCGVLSIPEQNLVDLYANLVVGTDFGTVDPVTGDLYMEYSVCYGGACRLLKSTYVKQ